jgi:hypothetical protein
MKIKALLKVPPFLTVALNFTFPLTVDFHLLRQQANKKNVAAVRNSKT